MDEFEKTLVELESLFVDPEFKKSIDEVKDINQLLANQPVTDEEAFNIIAGINDKWCKNGYFGRNLHIVGDAFVGGQHNDLEYEELKPESMTKLRGQPIANSGFSFQTTLKMQEDNLIVEQHIMLRGRMDVEESIGGIINQPIVMPLEVDTVIECRDLTPQKAAAWLEVYYPDTKVLIDECLLQAEDETEMVMNLKDTPLALSTGVRKNDRELRKMLQVYIASNLIFDQYMPYRAVLFGPAKIRNIQKIEWEKSNIMSENRSALNIKEPFVKLNRESHVFEVWLLANIIQRSKTDVTYCQIPLKSIESLESGRGIFSGEA